MSTPTYAELAAAKADAEHSTTQALRFAFSLACSLIDKGVDPRTVDEARVIAKWNEAVQRATERAKEGKT